MFVYEPCQPTTAPLQGLGIEITGSFLLVFGILSIVAVSERHSYGAVVVGIGIMTLIATLIIITAPYTGAGLNPARSFGPALAFRGGCWSSHWVYWAGPLIGGLIAGLLLRIMLFQEDLTKAPTSCCKEEKADKKQAESEKLVEAQV